MQDILEIIRIPQFHSVSKKGEIQIIIRSGFRKQKLIYS